MIFNVIFMSQEHSKLFLACMPQFLAFFIACTKNELLALHLVFQFLYSHC